MQETIDLIVKYFPSLTQVQQEQFFKLGALYEDWNSKVNLISRKDLPQLMERHVLHSLAIAKIISFLPNTKVLDVGTGGGFPGIPLAIIFPEVRFHLVDSIRKKTTAVESIALDLKLGNVNTICDRVENLNDQYDFVVSRAVTELAKLHAWIKNRIGKKSFNVLPNGILTFKGGEITNEIRHYKERAIICELKDHFSEAFFESKKIVYLPV